jgi:hypothetical protein
MSVWTAVDRQLGNDGIAHYWVGLAEKGDPCSCGHAVPLTGNKPTPIRDILYGHRWRIPACCTIRFIADSFGTGRQEPYGAALTTVTVCTFLAIGCITRSLGRQRGCCD